jgi:hypothetical protein
MNQNKKLNKFMEMNLGYSEEIFNLKNKICDDIDSFWEKIAENVDFFNDTTSEMFETFIIMEDDLKGLKIHPIFADKYPEIILYQVDIDNKCFKIFIHLSSHKISLKIINDSRTETHLDRVTYEIFYKYNNEFFQKRMEEKEEKEEKSIINSSINVLDEIPMIDSKDSKDEKDDIYKYYTFADMKKARDFSRGGKYYNYEAPLGMQDLVDYIDNSY